LRFSYSRSHTYKHMQTKEEVAAAAAAAKEEEAATAEVKRREEECAAAAVCMCFLFHFPSAKKSVCHV